MGLDLEWVRGLLQPGFVRWAPLLHRTILTTGWVAATICSAPLLRLWALRRLAPPSRPRLQSADHNVTVGSHDQYVPTIIAAAAWRVNAAVSKAAWWTWPLTLKVVSESRVTWATSVPMLVFLGLSVLDLGPMYATDRRQTASLLNVPAY